MAIASLAEPITVCTYGFNVPCRRFLISANVTRDRRLPVVDEFVLRTLKLCESVPVKRLGPYFGFSSSETDAVIGDLVNRGLVVVDGDAASLHPSAHQMFRGADDGMPRVQEIDPWVDRLWFDLVSHNMMAPDRSRPLPNLVNLRSDGMARDLPTSFARKAFEENFPEYLRKVRRINNPERVGLYSVSDVAPERFGSVVLKGREELVFDPQPHLRPHLLEVEVENILRYRPLTTALTDAYRLLLGPDPSAAGLAEFTRMVADTTVTDAHNPDGLFDLSNWLSANLSVAASERHTLIGASYLQRNVEFFVSLLEKRAARLASTGVPREMQILWYRPGGSGWGTSPDLQEALTALKGILRRALPKIAIRTRLVIPQVAKRDNPRRFERVFDDAYVTPAGNMSPSIEVLLVGEIGAIVLVRVKLSQVVSAFVGYAVVDSAGVERIRRNLSWDTIMPRSEELWSKPRMREEEDLSPEVSFPTDPDEN
jgi:hypothetical protein